MTRVTGNGQVFRTEVKRFRVPVVVEGECFGCGEKLTRELGTPGGIGYLSYPIAHEPFTESLYCEECDTETPVKLLLKISVEIV